MATRAVEEHAMPPREVDAALAETGKPHLRGCAVSFAKLKALLACDLYRYAGRADFRSFVRHYAFTPGFKYTVLMRTTGWLKRKPAMAFGAYPIFKWLLLRARYKYGFAIPEYTVIGPGLFLNRFGGFYIHGDAVIGCNVNLTHGTMLGYMNRGARAGAPVLGDRAFLGSGAKLIGGIRVGAESAIGVNAVVTKDVPDRGVAAGIPAKLLSEAGSDGYINRMAPPAMLDACEGAFADRDALSLTSPLASGPA
jgi:serine O-acetyltransferase